MKTALLVSILFLSINAFSQTFEKSFGGQWARTWWQFDFKKDGTFTRTSQGHYGDTSYEGTYVINCDTVTLLTGFNDTHCTVSEHYLIDEDSKLVGLTMFYDYAPNPERWFYNSETRTDIQAL